MKFAQDIVLAPQGAQATGNCLRIKKSGSCKAAFIAAGARRKAERPRNCGAPAGTSCEKRLKAR